MKAYHLFKLADAHFAYHIPAGRFIAISPEAYELLRQRQEDGSAPTANHQLLSDVAKLEEAGFFDEADPPILGDAEFEAEVRGRLASPRNSVFLSVASGCNLACRYCYCGVCRDQLPDKGLMAEDTALRAVDALFRDADPKQDVRITFFGGEPLLNKPVIRSVVEHSEKLAKARGVNAGFSITTNATLIDDETAALLTDSNFGLMVSLDGPKELHDAQCPTRGGDGSFELAAKGIRTLMKRRQVTVRCTMAHPAPDAMRLIRFFVDFGFSRVVLGTVRNPTFPSGCDFTAEDSAAFDRCMEREILPWMIAERKAGREPIYNPFDEIAEFQGEERHKDKVPAMRCGACHGSMAVGPDGTLYPCHRFVGMEAWAIGTLDDGPDRAKCEAFWRSWRECMKGECSRCWGFRICGGPCPWEIARADGTFAMSGQLCDETRAWMQHGAYYLHMTGDAGRNKGDKK